MDIHQALRADHQHLDALFEALLNCVHVNDAGATQAVWAELDHGLAAHLEAEEEHMLPLFDRFDATEAAAIRDDHANIRALMAELGVMLDIHALREDKVTELVAFLRAHAAREEAKLYPWATRDLPEGPRQSLLQWVRARGRRLHPWVAATPPGSPAR